MTKQGETRWVQASSRLSKKYGQIIGLRGVLTDITDKKHLEAQLLQAQKMEAVGTLAGGIAHDFNNLLTGIQGYVSLLLREIGPDHSFSQSLKNIESYVHSGARLTKQILGFARGGKYEVTSTNLNKLIEESSDIFGRTRKNIEIRRELAEDLWTVDVDQKQIEQVLLNLYLNAWQAMPENGDLLLQSENCVLEERQPGVADLKQGEYVKITVRDTGVGIDEEIIQRIFDPFFTTKDQERGTGLGLASSYGIIKNHNGTINVDSEPDNGTTFSIYLPASHGDVKKEISKQAGIHEGTETILIVDDEQLVLDVSKELLPSLGYSVRVASNGQEALDLCKDIYEELDLIILDMVMPGMSGEEVYEQLRDIIPSMKILFASGYSVDSQAQSILADERTAFIQKPFTLVDLSRKVRSILDDEQ